jgi:hypothetical protein
VEPISMFVAYALPSGREATRRLISELLAVQDEVSARLDEFAYELSRLRQSSWRAGRELLSEAGVDGWTETEQSDLLRRALERFLDGHGQLEGWEQVLCAVDVSLTYRLLGRTDHASRWALRAYREGVDFLGEESARRFDRLFDKVDAPNDDWKQSLGKWKKMLASPVGFVKQANFHTLYEQDPEVDVALSTGVVDSDRVKGVLTKSPAASSIMALYVMERYLDDLRDACLAMDCPADDVPMMVLCLDFSGQTRTWERVENGAAST